ncbi:MAG: hypothetical protein V7785_20575 [Bermanella sp.]
MKSYLFVLLSFFMALPQWANASYVDLQSGSLMGMVHASYGDSFFDNHHLSAGMGYVPKLDNHAEMTLFSLRYRYQNPYRFDFNVEGHDFQFSPVNFGTSLLYGNHSDLFLELPDQYPKGYYKPTALRIIFNYQSILHISDKTEVYFDISILDVGLITYVREPEFFMDNYDYLGLEGITNWGFGLRRHF